MLLTAGRCEAGAGSGSGSEVVARQRREARSGARHIILTPETQTQLQRKVCGSSLQNYNFVTRGDGRGGAVLTELQSAAAAAKGCQRAIPPTEIGQI